MKQSPTDFFYAHAGYSYQPDRETMEQGRRRCARSLAKAKNKARNLGVSFEWFQDGLTSRGWAGRGPAYNTWACTARNSDGKVIASLCGIDFGRDGRPWGYPYRRVIEAELALEANL